MWSWRANAFISAAEICCFKGGNCRLGLRSCHRLKASTPPPAELTNLTSTRWVRVISGCDKRQCLCSDTPNLAGTSPAQYTVDAVRRKQSWRFTFALGSLADLLLVLSCHGSSLASVLAAGCGSPTCTVIALDLIELLMTFVLGCNCLPLHSPMHVLNPLRLARRGLRRLFFYFPPTRSLGEGENRSWS